MRAEDSLPILKDIRLNLYELIDNASPEVKYLPFNTHYGRGFVLENDSIWLGYGIMGQTEQVELQFHHLPEEVVKSLEKRKELQAEIWGSDLLEGQPFAIEILSNLRERVFSCEAVYVHRGDLLGSRIDRNDYCCVGRTVQAFKNPSGELLPGMVACPPSAWFDEGNMLTSRAAAKYDLNKKINMFKGLCCLR